MKGITEEARNLINKIINIYYEKRISYNLSQGDILFIDNRRVVHGRSSFFPKYDGKDRFLIRSFITLDYQKSEYARINNGRIIQRIFS
jgi:L-asparagine oxygenase